MTTQLPVSRREEDTAEDGELLRHLQDDHGWDPPPNVFPTEALVRALHGFAHQSTGTTAP
jgi:hypothetical protein